MNLVRVNDLPREAIFTENMKIVFTRDNILQIIFIVWIIVVWERITGFQEQICAFVYRLLFKIEYVALISWCTWLFTDATKDQNLVRI